MGDGPVRGSADLSPCGRYRYRLTRQWDDAAPPLAFVMLNPSTADGDRDDATVRRCVAVARRTGAGGIVVANLYAFRAPDPRSLRRVDDPVGPDNATVHAALIAAGGPVVCAWGAVGGRREEAGRFVAAARLAGVRLLALGLTRDGHPRHPLYVRREAPLRPYVSEDALNPQSRRPRPP